MYVANGTYYTSELTVIGPGLLLLLLDRCYNSVSFGLLNNCLPWVSIQYTLTSLALQLFLFKCLIFFLATFLPASIKAVSLC
jgi:hypothetical protein